MSTPMSSHAVPSTHAARGSLVRMTARQLIDVLTRAVEHEQDSARLLVVFDADGTLWRCDVGEMLFEAALAARAIREEASSELHRLAAHYRIDTSGSANELAARLYRAYRTRVIPERVGAEMLIWAYAGWTPHEWRAFADRTIADLRLAQYLNRPAVEVLRWAQRTGLLTRIISASPHAAVGAAAALLDVESFDVIAAAPRVVAQRFVALLDDELPWAERKVEAGRRAVPEAAWFAALGDSAFDAAMLQTSRYPVAVCPRADLHAKLHDLRGCTGLSAVELIAANVGEP